MKQPDLALFFGFVGIPLWALAHWCAYYYPQGFFYINIGVVGLAGLFVVMYWKAFERSFHRLLMKRTVPTSDFWNRIESN